MVTFNNNKKNEGRENRNSEEKHWKRKITFSGKVIGS